ncbi:MAG: hypothetical protein ACQERN_14595 [Thermodesulfobacteriota bacterium]
MHIPSHQVNNVLKAYKNLLMRKKQADGAEEVSADASGIEFSDKRRVVAEKITRDIARRILEEKRQEPENSAAAEDTGQNHFPARGFLYNSVTGQNGKVARRLTIEATDFLANGAEEKG